MERQILCGQLSFATLVIITGASHITITSGIFLNVSLSYVSSISGYHSTVIKMGLMEVLLKTQNALIIQKQP